MLSVRRFVKALYTGRRLSWEQSDDAFGFGQQQTLITGCEEFARAFFEVIAV